MFLEIYAPIAVGNTFSLNNGHSVGTSPPVGFIIRHPYDPNSQACLAQLHVRKSSLPRPASPHKLKGVAQLHLNHKIIEIKLGNLINSSLSVAASMCHFVSRLLFLDRSPFFFLTRTHCVSAGLHLQPSLLCCCTCMSFRVVETRQIKSRMEWHYPQFLCKYKYFLYFSYPSPKEQIQVGSFAPYKTNKSQLPK